MQEIEDFFSKHHILLDSPLAIGVSGGADSLAAVLLIRKTFPELPLVALTVDHKLRPTSSDEANYVVSIMQKFGIEHHTLVWEGDKPQTGIEEKARIARYDLLCGWCREHSISALVLAHHAFDQAETFLMRLQRGSGVYGLSAMNEVSSRGGIMLLRPFLNVHPDFFKQYLKGENICWVEDESNHCTDFLRVKMRRFLPDMEAATGISAAKICVAANNLQRTKSFLEDTIANIIADKIHVWGVSGCSFDYAEFLSWHEELRFHILGCLIRRFGAGDYAPEADSLLDLSQNLLNDGFSAQTLGGCHILKQDLRLWIIKEYREENSAYSTDMWEKFTANNPSVRGIKLPFLLKEALLREK